MKFEWNIYMLKDTVYSLQFNYSSILIFNFFNFKFNLLYTISNNKCC
jgi:hypothetical protein